MPSNGGLRNYPKGRIYISSHPQPLDAADAFESVIESDRYREKAEILNSNVSRAQFLKYFVQFHWLKLFC